MKAAFQLPSKSYLLFCGSVEYSNLKVYDKVAPAFLILAMKTSSLPKESRTRVWQIEFQSGPENRSSDRMLVTAMLGVRVFKNRSESKRAPLSPSENW